MYKRLILGILCSISFSVVAQDSPNIKIMKETVQTVRDALVGMPVSFAINYLSFPLSTASVGERNFITWETIHSFSTEYGICRVSVETKGEGQNAIVISSWIEGNVRGCTILNEKAKYIIQENAKNITFMERAVTAAKAVSN